MIIYYNLMSHIVAIDASPKQLSKLRNGHPVRIRKGEGFNLIVHPNTYHLVSRAFSKNRGIEIALSPEEIQANRQLSPEEHAKIKEDQPEMAGQGIFGKKFDKQLKKAGVKKLAYKIADDIKPYAKASLAAGLTSGATALGAFQPELIPFLPGGVAALTALGSDYLDRPGYYQRGFSGIKGDKVKSLAEKAVKAKLNEKLNEQLGTNYDYMSRAGLENASKAALASQLSADAIASRYGVPTSAADKEAHMDIYGYGLSRRREIGSIHGRGTSVMGVGYFPPALVSQPFSANFQMSHFLPVQYQHFNSGSGLYAGKGLGTGLGTGL